VVALNESLIKHDKRSWLNTKREEVHILKSITSGKALLALFLKYSLVEKWEHGHAQVKQVLLKT
jgi:hypothetical protein